MPWVNFRILYVLFLHFTNVRTIPIDNGLVKDPEIICGVDFIVVNFQTRNPFLGHVYAKGYYAQELCRFDSSEITNQPSIRLRLDSCGVRRLRSANPPGLYQTVVVVVTFHPYFETKVDRAVNIQCFYTESRNVVTQQIDVSMLSTETRMVKLPMPICRYEVLNFEQSYGPYLSPLRFARVGQPVLHKWRCDTEVTGTYCMTVHSCTVDDGLSRQKSNSIRLLDESGCAMDRYLLGNVEYPQDLVAQKESHVFKYADKTLVYFQCQISLTYKPEIGCPRPSCSEPIRGKRSVNFTSQDDPVGVLDVSKSINVLDVDWENDRQQKHANQFDGQFFNGNTCLAPITFFVSILLSIVLATTTTAVVICWKKM